MFNKNIFKRFVASIAAASMLGAYVSAGASDNGVSTDFSGDTFPANLLVKEIKKDAINNDANGYHYETGVAGRAADDRSIVFDLTLEKGEEDTLGEDGIHYGNGTVNGNRTMEFSVMFDGDYGEGVLLQGKPYKQLLQFTPDGSINALQANTPNGDIMALAGTYKKGEWVKIAITWNPNGSYTFWINDLLAMTGYSFGGAVTQWGWIRIGTKTAANTSDTPKNIRFAVDDFKAYDGDYTPTAYANRLKYEPTAQYTFINKTRTLVIPQNAALTDLMSGINVTNANVRVYTDSTFKTQVTDESAVISEGAKVVVEALNNDRIDTWTISTNAELRKIAALDFEGESSPVSFVDINTSYESAELTNGGYGKASKAYVATASNVPAATATGGRFNMLDSLSTSIGSSGTEGGTALMASEKNIMTMEYSLLLDGDFSQIEFSGMPMAYNINANSNERIYARYLTILPDGSVTYVTDDGETYESTQKLEKGKWNRIAMTINPETFGCEFYINGVKATGFIRLHSSFKDRDVFVYKGFSWISPIMKINADENAQSARTAKMAVDDIEVYYGAYSNDEADTAEIVETNLDMNGNTLYLGDDASVYSFITETDFGSADFAIYEDNTYQTQLGSDDELSEGNVVVLTSESENTYNYYYVAVPVKTVELKTYVDGVEGEVIAGPSTIGAEYTSEESGNVLLLAVYDADGNLVKVVIDDTAPYNASYAISNAEGIEAKAMVWDSLYTMNPRTAFKEFINVGNIE